MGNQILIICFVVVVIGGIGSINGAMIASLAIGLADTLGKVVAAEYSGVAVYLVMAVILLWRPKASPTRPDAREPTSRLPRSLLIAAVLLLALFPASSARLSIFSSAPRS